VLYCHGRIWWRRDGTERDLSGILVVDDHAVIAKACGHVFESIGIERIISAQDVDSGRRQKDALIR
jgi:hypothetical protein